MSLVIRFVFIGEGTSDESLIPHLRELCYRCGADDAKNIQIDKNKLPKNIGHSISQKVRAALQLASNTNLLFIHRDADGGEPTPRYDEIAEAMESLGLSIPYVAVVPVQETEAWLLLDEEAIQDVVKNRIKRIHLNLPTPSQVEHIANPKERLKEVLATASGLRGRRLQKFNNSFSAHRRELLESLDLDGPISKVPAWQRLFKDTCEVIEQLKQNSTN